MLGIIQRQSIFLTVMIKTQHSQIMAIITNRILKFKLMIKKSIVTNHTFFTYLSRTNLNYLQKDCHQDNLAFLCL